MLIRMLFFLLIGSFLVILLPRVIIALHTSSQIYHVKTAPKKRVALIFGAGLWRDGSPSPVLRDRVATAAELYFSGKVDKLLMSGDNRFLYYNEPGAMQEYAIKLGVSAEDIILDYAGRRTYDSCFRARDIFKATDLVLVTQGFHLPRALYTCHALGMSAIGVIANLGTYHPLSILSWHLREIPATLVALWELHASHPLPVLGEPEPIFTSDKQ